MSVPTISAGTVRALAERGSRGRASETAFQAVLVAVARALEDVIARVRAAESAALSLAQRQKVAAVADGLAATAGALQEALSKQGRCLLNGRRSLRERVKEAGEKVRETLAHRQESGSSWWFALSEAVEALDGASAQISALAAAQPAAAPAAALGREVVAQLDAHREALLAESERWVG